MGNYKFKADAIIDLQQRGYDHDFILKNENLQCIQDNEVMNPNDFEITESYLFDGSTHLSDQFVIYAIRSRDVGVKGILMISCGAFAKGVSIHLWSKLVNNLKFSIKAKQKQPTVLHRSVYAHA